MAAQHTKGYQGERKRAGPALQPFKRQQGEPDRREQNRRTVEQVAVALRHHKTADLPERQSRPPPAQGEHDADRRQSKNQYPAVGTIRGYQQDRQEQEHQGNDVPDDIVGIRARKRSAQQRNPKQIIERRRPDHIVQPGFWIDQHKAGPDQQRADDAACKDKSAAHRDFTPAQPSRRRHSEQAVDSKRHDQPSHPDQSEECPDSVQVQSNNANSMPPYGMGTIAGIAM